MSKKSTDTEKEESEINPQNKDNTTEKKELTCGIVMPISPIDGCNAEHWSEVLSILKESICDAEFIPKLVSDADDSGIIQNRIVQNLYKSDIVVCDVSAKNPNVMFELGLRLAFDKPTIIVKDDKTDYSFDTSIIEHLLYPRELRFSKINKFKQDLTDKIQATHEAAQKEGYTTFLKHFGEFKVAKLEQKEVGFNDYVLKKLNNIEQTLSQPNYSNEKRFARTNMLKGPNYRRITVGEVVELLESFEKDQNIDSNQLAHSPDLLNTFAREYIRKYWNTNNYLNEDIDFIAANVLSLLKNSNRIVENEITNKAVYQTNRSFRLD